MESVEKNPGDVATASLTNSDAQTQATSDAPFVPTLGAWAKPPRIIPEVVSNIQESQTIPMNKGKSNPELDILPPAFKEDGQLRFPWAARMDPSIRNLHRTTTPSYMEDGTPKVHIPDHVLLKGLENQKEYVIGQFNRCLTPSGGLINAVANRIWGKKCKIFSRKLGESSYLFHIPDAPTRAWVLQRGLWHIDDCIMFVAPWTSDATLASPEITSVPIWVTLKNIPSRLYSRWGISWIASGLGEPMATDKPRLDPSLMGAAKILVEVELEKGFPHRIAVEDKRGNVSLVDVEYSWLPPKCSRCGILGHKETRCLLLSKSGSASNLASIVAEIPVVVEGNKGSQTTLIEAAKISSITTPIVAQETLVDCTSPDVAACTSVSSLLVEAALIDTTVCTYSPTFVAGHITPKTTTITTALCNPTPTNIEAAMSSSPVETVSFTPPRSGSLQNEIVHENVLGSNIPTSPVVTISPPLESYTVISTPPHVVTYEFEEPVNPVTGVQENSLALLEPMENDLNTELLEDVENTSNQRTLRERPVKPTQKAQEMEWTVVGGRSNRGRRGRGGRGHHS